MRRRELLSTISAASLGAAPFGLLTHHRQGSARLGNADAAWLQRAEARLYRLDYQHGGENLWQAAVAATGDGYAMLEHGTYNGSVGKLLLHVTSRMQMCAGWLAFDAGRHDVARCCYNEALSLARQADDHVVEAFALACLAFQSNILGRPREAARFADGAERGAQVRAPDRPARLRVLPQFRRAVSCAMTGDGRGADLAITSARSILDRECDQPTEAFLAFVTPVEADGVEATCAMRLNQAKRAERLLARAIAGHPDRYARNRALYQVRLARVRLEAGAIDGAAEAAHAAYHDLGNDVTSWRVDVELKAVTAKIADYPQVPGVDAVLAHASRATARRCESSGG